MVKHFLITRPKHDKETSYLYSFSKNIVKKVKEEKDIKLVELEGKNATRSKLEYSISRTNPKLIFLNGHGTNESVWGYKDEPILDKENITISKDKIVYALACSSLAKLGIISKEKGTEAYIGYEREFACVYDPSRVSSPDKDKNVVPFRKACNFLIDSLVFGTSVSESINRTKEVYRKLIKSYGTSEDDYGDAPLIGFALTWNLMFLGMQGNPNASF